MKNSEHSAKRQLPFIPYSRRDFAEDPFDFIPDKYEPVR